jgi:large subunit ribosomal protein L25
MEPRSGNLTGWFVAHATRSTVARWSLFLMPDLLLAATTGREIGSRPSRRLRRTGRVPAVVYGLGSDPVTVSIDSAELRAALNTEAGTNALITLDVEGDTQLSIITDLQRHPVRRDVLHVDFLRVDPDAEVTVEVPLVLVGEAKKITQASGMVDQIMHHVPVRARPGDIPVEVRADVSDLEVGISLRVIDIHLPDGVTPAGDPEAPFAVGVITRSTKEFLRAERLAEEEAEMAEFEGVEGEAPAEGEDGAAAGDGDGDAGESTDES